MNRNYGRPRNLHFDRVLMTRHASWGPLSSGNLRCSPLFHHRVQFSFQLRPTEQASPSVLQRLLSFWVTFRTLPEKLCSHCCNSLRTCTSGTYEGCRHQMQVLSNYLCCHWLHPYCESGLQGPNGEQTEGWGVSGASEVQCASPQWQGWICFSDPGGCQEESWSSHGSPQ